jgi:anti-anti-sigma factor
MSGSVEDFAVEITDDGRGVMIRVVGDLDMATAELLGAELERAVDSFAGDVTVNLAAVTFLDSTGLIVLLRGYAALGALGRRLVVAAPARAVKHILELTGLQDTFQLAPEPRGPA